ncbi:MAG: tetratricopeptide repeat protein [Gemmatimonadaceae bacterium]|nr:tetratricopeptide repeat protein [Gemmatimonadaceae bacterium]
MSRIAAFERAATRAAVAMAGALAALAMTVAAAPAAAAAQGFPRPEAPQSYADARLAIATGRYPEAIAFLEKMPRNDTSWFAAQADLARALALVSRYDDAERVARAAAGMPGGREALTALGEVLRTRGRLDSADSAFARAVRERASDSLMARVNLALLDQRRGRRARADSAFDRFIDVYNANAAALSSREMMAVAIAVRELGAGNPDLFRDALRAFDRAVAIDPANVDARIAIGELFLAKYNASEAQKTLDEVLGVNPSHPEALVAAARRAAFDGQPGADSSLAQALTVSPEYVPARVMVAQRLVDVERYDDAAREAERALKVDPSSAEALAVLATARFVAGDERGFNAARERALAINPRDAGFYVTLAEGAGRVRRYAVAADFARQAVAADSTNWKARSVLGMNLLRLGRIAEGKAALDASFKGDPYDVWVKNTLDLLDTFKNYDETRTPHALLMIEKTESPVLSIYLSDLAERAYTTFAQRYRYEPPPPIRIEVYRSHADFSVRTVGLAGLGALGVSFGTTLAFDSPAARDAGPFNWASTVWHELAHTFTLGATDHRVPRWLSEGLSVWEEHRARPGWGQSVSPEFLGAFQQGRLVPVSRMNDGFMRPAFPEQVILSYYQASLICDLIARDFGEQAIVALLGEYKAGRTTDEAFRAVLKESPAAFDKRFDAYVKSRFARALAALVSDGPEYPAGMLPDELAARADSMPGSWRTQMLAAEALTRARRPADAIRALERAHALFPEYGGAGSPAAALSGLYLQRGDTAKAMAMLGVVAQSDESAFEANMMLGRLALARRDTAAAVDAFERAVWINPFPADLHSTLATIAAARKDHARAIRERRALVALDPVDKAEALYQLAVAYRDGGDATAAKRAVLGALEEAPNFGKAQDLLLAIVEGGSP